ERGPEPLHSVELVIELRARSFAEILFPLLDATVALAHDSDASVVAMGQERADEPDENMHVGEFVAVVIFHEKVEICPRKCASDFVVDVPLISLEQAGNRVQTNVTHDPVIEPMLKHLQIVDEHA